jgi:RNA polymerase sigma-70 factor (ECF subfamily)
VTERQIIEGIQQSNRQAMQEMYCQLAGYAMSTAMRYLSDQEAARDVLHDSFIKAYTKAHQFHYKGEGSLKAWVMRIVANESLNVLRQNAKIHFTDQIPDDEADQEPDIPPIPPDELNKMIQRLPSGYRTVLNLYVFEQKSHKEIAQLIGIKENSSASQFLRAKRMLAKMINDYKTHSHDR